MKAVGLAPLKEYLREEFIEDVPTQKEDLRSQKWQQKYEQLREYFQQHGHSNVSFSDKTQCGLVKWINNQRMCFKRGTLPQERIELLNDLNFIWDAHELKWQEKYQEFKAYYETYGHSGLLRQDPAYKTLDYWVSRQRLDYKKGRLSPKRIELLNELDFIWDANDTKWRDNYQVLKAYYQTYGHCNVPATEQSETPLGTWVRAQRQKYKDGKLTQERIDALNELAFIWDAHEMKWQDKYQELQTYYQTYGHTQVSTLDPTFSELGVWLTNQRQFYKRGQLSSERIHLLNKLHVAWEIPNLKWQERYQELKAYYDTYGDLSALEGKSTFEFRLWMGTQRQNYRKGTLTQERIDLLNELNFVWEPQEDKWNERYEELKTYYATYGNTNVPTPHAEYPSLGAWVRRQRVDYKQGRLSQDRIELLNELNIVWNVQEFRWQQKYQAVVHFYKTFGHTNISILDETYGLLGKWIYNQRQFYKKGKLSKEKIELLKALEVREIN